MSAGASNNAPTISPNGILLRKSASSLAIEAAIQAQSGSGSNCERAARRQRSAPERLDLGENRVRVAGACQDRIKARVLTTGQQPGREGALRSAAAASALPAAIAVILSSCTAMSLRSPRQSCTRSSAERNFARRRDAFLPGKRLPKNSDA